ncbi:hypothetical protein [Mesorhizobium sp. CO1-1-8]|uniref:hypothetical protein n=1 Tax=Mesorhizobium sp. CO1-1-8 TaxID=2876631 RepID=UPI00398EDDF8
MSDEAAERLAALKKQPMAEAAEQLLAGTSWLPALMRTTEPAALGEPRDVTGEAAAAADEPSGVDFEPSQCETDLAATDSGSVAEQGEPLHIAAE